MPSHSTTFAAPVVLALVVVATTLQSEPTQVRSDAPTSDHALAPTPAILVIAADDPTLTYVRQIVEGIRQALDVEHPPALYIEYFDQVRFGDEAHISAFTEWLSRKYQGRRVDVVVTIGQSSLRLLADRNGGPWPGVPVSYLSLSDLTIDISKSLPAATGVIIDNPLPNALRLITQILPGTHRIAFASGASPEERARGRWMTDQITQAGFELLDLSGLTIEEVLARVAHLPQDTAILHVGVAVDGAGRILTTQQSCRLVSAAASRPLFALGRGQLGCGILGGPLVDYELVGRAVGTQALARLHGEHIATIHLPLAQYASPVFDARQLERWQISEDRLPAGSEVVFRPPTLWRDHRGAVLLALSVGLLQTALIGVVLYEQQRRKRAQAALRVSYDEARVLAGRLISTREEERTRVARELHDNLSQKVALLSLDVDRAAKTVQGRREASDRLISVADRARDIATDLYDLSHQLHPSKLETLGLAAALRGLCGEISSADGLRVEFLESGVPRKVRPDAALCLFRIAQEALHNVAKHSGATRAEVGLRLVGEALHLEVTDEGRGFAQGVRSTHGLGLLSMRERVSLVSGQIEIESAAGAGTRVRALVPLHQPEVRAVS